MAGLDDASFARLEARDDAQRNLFDLMREEGLKLSDLMRLKKQYEEQGHWLYRADKVSERLKVVERKKIERAKAAELVDEDDEARLRRDLEARRPLPRSAAVCGWKGYDRDGNLYWCNNGVFTHPRTHEKHKECAYHVKFCVGLHPTGAVELQQPNKLALCYTHHVAATGDVCEEFDNELLVPGIVFARAGTTRHALAPPVAKVIVAAALDPNADDYEQQMKIAAATAKAAADKLRRQRLLKRKPLR